MPSLILWEAKGSCVYEKKPHCVIVRVCVCVYFVSREHDYYLQQLLSLSQQAFVLYYITFIISPFLSTGQTQTDRLKTTHGFCIYPFVLCSGQFNTHCSYSHCSIKPQQKSKCSLYVTHEQGLPCQPSLWYAND